MATVPNKTANLNQNYLIRIFGQNEADKAVDIVASMAENFSMRTSSHWDPLLNTGSLGAAIANSLPGLGPLTGVVQRGLAAAGGITSKVFGYSDQYPALTQLLWTSSSPIDFSIPLKFNAITDANLDVMQPMLQLTSLPLPSKATGTLGRLGTLIGPGPRLFNNKYNIALQIGRNLIFPRIIVQNISDEYDSMFDKDGNCISTTVNVEITTSRVVTKEDLAANWAHDPKWSMEGDPQSNQTINLAGGDPNENSTGNNQSPTNSGNVATTNNSPTPVDGVSPFSGSGAPALSAGSFPDTVAGRAAYMDAVANGVVARA